MGEGGVGVLSLPPETFSRYQALRGGAPARSATGTLQNVVIGPTSGETSHALTAEDPAMYSLRAVYFNPKQFHSAADCLTAASMLGLPLDLCK
jgi:hypothetical protein